jgi:hypothetical protein
MRERFDWWPLMQTGLLLAGLSIILVTALLNLLGVGVLTGFVWLVWQLLDGLRPLELLPNLLPL